MVDVDSFIQIIDCSAIRGEFDKVPKHNFSKIAEELGKAMSGIGFAYLINHGLDSKKIMDVHRVSKEFFTLPSAEKRKFCKGDPIESFHGYAPSGDELHDPENSSMECREAFDISGNDALDPTKYPQQIAGFKQAFDDVRKDMNNMGKKILRCYGKYLKLEDEDFFVKTHACLTDPKVKSPTEFRTMYYYPMDLKETQVPPDAIRLGEHSDWGTITLLFQDMVGGLEIKTRTGEWIQATPVKDAIIVNNGYLMELYTAGILHAAPHRVRIPKEIGATRLRQTFIQFICPDGDEEVRPVVPIPDGKEEFGNMTSVKCDDYIKDKLRAVLGY